MHLLRNKDSDEVFWDQNGLLLTIRVACLGLTAARKGLQQPLAKSPEEWGDYVQPYSESWILHFCIA
jgi:hypothetical protein